MKIYKDDLTRILQSFAVADDPKQGDIDQIKSSNPSSTNQAVDFRFRRRPYRLIIDEDADDNLEYLRQQLGEFVEDQGDFLRNPKEAFETYGIPYLGKTIYLFQPSSATRLDVYLTASNPRYSRSSWQKLIKQGAVRVNGDVQQTPKYPVTTEDVITFDEPEAESHKEQTLPIIYMDDQVIVVNKPAGVLTHAKNPLDREFTVAEFFRRYTTVGLESDRPGIVHRLDRDTSGVIIGARTPEAFEYLKTQFADRNVSKTYVAIVEGDISEPQMIIDVPIARNMARPGSFIGKIGGKPAQTKLRVLATNSHFSEVELQPKTGRTHQLRVHLAHIGHPIHGDRLYGHAADRLYLHALSLEITLPTGELQTFTSNLPPEFSKLIEQE